MESGFWTRPETLEAIRTIVVALLVALLTVLGYDVTVAKKRVERLIKRQGHKDQ